MNIARNTTTIDQIDWNGDQISYGETIEFSMSDFRSFISGLITSTRSLLFTDLLFNHISTQSTQKIPEIPWPDIHDNPLKSTPFENYLTNSRTNLKVEQAERWLYNRIMTNPTLKRRFRKTNSK